MLTIRRIVPLLAIAVLCSWSSVAMARWGVALDAPVFWAYDNAEPNKQSGNTPADWTNAEGANLDGFLLAIYTPLNIRQVAYLGLGVDEYSVTGTVAIPNNGGGPNTANGKTELEIYDLIVDFPTELFNFGLGYGVGNAKTTIIFPGILTVPLSNANVTQEIASFGVVLGRFDIHLSYRWVKVDDVVIPNIGNSNGNNPTNFYLASGRLTTLGVRMNFGN